MIPAHRFISPISFSNQVFLVYLGGMLDFNSHWMYPFTNNSKPLLQENGTYICFNKSYFFRWKSLGVYSSKNYFFLIYFISKPYLTTPFSVFININSLHLDRMWVSLFWLCSQGDVKFFSSFPKFSDST